MPSEDVEAERNVGALLSIVELFVTGVMLREAASLPSAS